MGCISLSCRASALSVSVPVTEPRNLLYTGVTRGKRLVVLVGQKKAVAMAVRGGNVKRRWTKLRKWLAAS